jgi:hypothetical protein
MSQLVTELRRRVTHSANIDGLYSDLVCQLCEKADNGESDARIQTNDLRILNRNQPVSRAMIDALCRRLELGGVTAEYICPDRPGATSFLLVEWHESTNV